MSDYLKESNRKHALKMRMKHSTEWLEDYAARFRAARTDAERAALYQEKLAYFERLRVTREAIHGPRATEEKQQRALYGPIGQA